MLVQKILDYIKSTASGQSHRGMSSAKTNLFDASIGAFKSHLVGKLRFFEIRKPR
jgi:hypothetical protein